MEKENIITINQTHHETDFNWAIKRYLPNFNDARKTIIGVQFLWNRIFLNEKKRSHFSDKVSTIFNEFQFDHFFDSLNYVPEYRDVFLIKMEKFSAFYWLEFIFTKDKWNLKTKGYSWENESFIYAIGNNTTDDFIVNEVNSCMSSSIYDYENADELQAKFNQRKFKLPIYGGNINFEESNFIFHYNHGDARRIDYQSRSVDLFIDEDFDYFLHIDSNEYSVSAGKQINYIQQGQIPQKIFHQLVDTILNNKYYQAFGRGGISNKERNNFKFKINNKIHEARFMMTDDESSLEYKNLNLLKHLITEWVDKIVEFQKNI